MTHYCMTGREKFKAIVTPQFVTLDPADDFGRFTKNPCDSDLLLQHPFAWKTTQIDLFDIVRLHNRDTDGRDRASIVE